MSFKNAGKNKLLVVLLAIAVTMAFSTAIDTSPASAATYPTYTISTTSSPCNKTFKKFTTYNSKTKHYYLLRSYMEKFEKKGGGTLILNAGTYNIPVTVYIPKNVTIIFRDGVVLNKTFSTGTRKVAPSYAMFMLCAPAKAKKANSYKAGKYKYGYKQYNGVRNVNITGEGSVTLNMRSLKYGMGFMLCHNKNINISGISFINMNRGHFIEMDASYNVKVSGCSFANASTVYTQADRAKEAINLDTPDLKTGGFNAPWSSFDKTANDTITIDSCTFTNLYRSVGTHNYSLGHPHKYVTVSNCTITDMKCDAISAMYWYHPTIINNTIANVTRNSMNFRGIIGPGTIEPTIIGNTFSNMNRVAQFYIYKDNGYGLVKPSFTSENIENLASGNTYHDIGEDLIRINYYWNSNKNIPNWDLSSKISIVDQ